MKILIMGSTQGDLSIVNHHAEKSNADVILCTGDLGIFYRKEDFKKLPKSFKSNNFCDYLEGKETFIKPVFSIRGAHDNLSLCNKLYNKDIHIENFTLIPDGEIIKIHNDKNDILSGKEIVVGGIGGSYSPKYYDYENLTGNKRRHFISKDIEKLQKNSVHILLMHDLIGDNNRKKILFSNEVFKLIDSCRPFYCIVGKYHWWSYLKISSSNFVTVPFADRGYLLIDTDNEWNAEGIRFDLDIGGKINDKTIR